MKFRVKSTLKYSVQRMTPTKAVRIALLVINDALILNIASFWHFGSGLNSISNSLSVRRNI